MRLARLACVMLGVMTSTVVLPATALAHPIEHCPENLPAYTQSTVNEIRRTALRTNQELNRMGADIVERVDKSCDRCDKAHCPKCDDGKREHDKCDDGRHGHKHNKHCKRWWLRLLWKLRCERACGKAEKDAERGIAALDREAEQGIRSIRQTRAKALAELREHGGTAAQKARVWNVAKRRIAAINKNLERNKTLVREALGKCED